MTLAERKTRFNIQLLADSTFTNNVTKTIARWLDTIIMGSVKSITADNDSEFTNLTEGCRLVYPVYFAHPNLPWQRGTNEHHTVC